MSNKGRTCKKDWKKDIPKGKKETREGEDDDQREMKYGRKKKVMKSFREGRKNSRLTTRLAVAESSYPIPLKARQS